VKGASEDALFKVDRLTVSFGSAAAEVAAVRDVSFKVRAAECLAIVGESGSGKTQIFMASLGLLPVTARVGGEVHFEGVSLLNADTQTLNRVRGSALSMVFQDPGTALTPHLRIGTQLTEVLIAHAGLARDEAWQAAARMLERVGMADAERRMHQYPHELSGGLRQRVLIGMALLCRPRLLIADEPTTALDVTLQAQIIELLRAARNDNDMALVLISHDLGVVAEIADRIMVMYAGRIVESAACSELLQAPAHPYTAELIRCMPRVTGAVPERMATLAGETPSSSAPEHGCAFAPRCAHAQSRCREERPELKSQAQRLIACHFPVRQ
jgi:oligopeptide transport system ATP-binding protein